MRGVGLRRAQGITEVSGTAMSLQPHSRDLPCAGRDRLFFAACTGKTRLLRPGQGWARLGRAGSLEGLALGEISLAPKSQRGYGPGGCKQLPCTLPPCTHVWQGTERTAPMVAPSPSLSQASVSCCSSSPGASPFTPASQNHPHLQPLACCSTGATGQVGTRCKEAMPGWVLPAGRRVQAGV